MTKKKGLGKGLSALLADKPIAEGILEGDRQADGDSVQMIPLNLIKRNKDQPRKDFDDASLEDLSISIEKHGVIQPILLRKLDKGYGIVAGERRYRASKLLNLEKIPSIILEVDGEEAAKLALIENVQREDLNPVEEAQAYRQLMEDFQLKQDELGQAIGKSRSYISNSLRLLNLEKEVLEYLYQGEISTGHAKALLAIKDRRKQLDLANQIIDRGLNVRETEKQVSLIKKGPSKKKDKVVKKDPHIIDMEDELMRILGTKVNLISGKKRGKIEIEYYSLDDLDRIIDLLKG